MMREVFAEVYSVSEVLEEDAAILREIKKTGNNVNRESPAPTTIQQERSGKSKRKMLIPIVLLLLGFLFYKVTSHEERPVFYEALSKKPDPTIKTTTSPNTSSSNAANPSKEAIKEAVIDDLAARFIFLKTNVKVRTVQQLLKNGGYDVGIIDGKMGPRTSTAIRKYQLDNGLVPDGLVTANLYAHLLRETPNKTIDQAVAGWGKGLKIVKPPVGSTNTLSVPQICWCLRESIRLDTMRRYVSTNSAIEKFNQFVNDYNIRCGSFQYYESEMAKAREEISKYREQIIKNAGIDAQKIF
jgi:hypothetical protein